MLSVFFLIDLQANVSRFQTDFNSRTDLYVVERSWKIVVSEKKT